MTATPQNPIADGAAANPFSFPTTGVAVESWENEGGHFPPLPSVQRASSGSPSLIPVETKSSDLAAMRAKFLTDFAGGLVGQHHNTYQHRSRVLRQRTGRGAATAAGSMA